MRGAIVCVDDEWNILRSLGSQLKRNFGNDYDIELVNSGEEALLLCEELIAEGKDIPLIVSDRNMQGMKGDVLLVQLHSLYPKTLKIMLTGQADADAVGNVVNAAALYRYIRKPWDDTDLILTATEALRRYQCDRQLAEQNEFLQKMNTELENSLSLLSATLEATADGIVVLDNLGKISNFNQKFAKIWDLEGVGDLREESNSINRILTALKERDAIDFHNSLISTCAEKRDCLELHNGKIIEYYLQPQRLSGEIVGKVLSFRDVTKEKQEEALIRDLAVRDSLTNLPNRLWFDRQLAATLTNVAALSQMMAVIFIDLDRFKSINDTYSHAVGDLLLQEAARRFTSCLRSIDLLSRRGGDEFVLLLPQISCAEDASAIACRLLDSLRSPFLIQRHSLQMTASLGIAVYPEDGLDAATLLENADNALYRAKREGRNRYLHYERSTS